MALKIFNILLLVVVFAGLGYSQDPTHWRLTSTAAGQLKDGDIVKAQLAADIDEGWHLYAMDQPAGGPIATTIKIADGSPFEIVGNIEAPKPTVRPDPNFVVDGKPLETKFF